MGEMCLAAGTRQIGTVETVDRRKAIPFRQSGQGVMMVWTGVETCTMLQANDRAWIQMEGETLVS